jgi:hypothetical protein
MQMVMTSVYRIRDKTESRLTGDSLLSPIFSLVSCGIKGCNIRKIINSNVKHHVLLSFSLFLERRLQHLDHSFQFHFNFVSLESEPEFFRMLLF